MSFLPFETIRSYRQRTFRLLPGQRLNNQEEAIAYVGERGFIYFWPITGIILPSLWTAVAGDRPVADAHDDPGHVTWGWKDGLLGQRRWYYAKVLRKRATIISLDMAPYFYALSENYGSPEDDYLTLYEQGRLTLEAKMMYEALLDKGPLDTVALRRAIHLTSQESDSRFNRALTDLQTDFKILPVGVADAGAWHYAFIYDITARHFPELPDQAHLIHENEARFKLAECYFRSLGAAQASELARLFGWRTTDVNRAVQSLIGAGTIIRNLEIENRPGEWVGLAELIECDPIQP
jgi:hypothetical protein